MAIDPIEDNEASSSVRAKINAAIAKANLVDGKASAETLAAEQTARGVADTALSQAIAAEGVARAEAISAEAADRAQYDQALSVALNNEAQERGQYDTALSVALNEEAATRAGAIAALSDQLASETGARQTAVAAATAAIEGEKEARRNALTAEAAARDRAIAIEIGREARERETEDGRRPTYAEAGGVDFRPGEVAAFFTTATDGMPEALAPLAADRIATGAHGAVGVIDGRGTIATRAAWRVEPGRQYRARYVVQRAEDTDDPAQDAVRLALRWLDRNKSGVATTICADLVDIAVDHGRVEYEYNFGTAASDMVEFVAPAGAVYVRPYVQAFGSGVTHVEVIAISDLSEAVDFSPDVSEFRRQLAGYNFRLEDFSTRLEIAEENIEASHDAAWFTRGTLSDARLSKNVMLLGLDQVVNSVKTFAKAQKFGDALLIGAGKATGGGATARIVGDGNYFAIAPTNLAGGYVTLKEFGFDGDGDGVWFAEGGFTTTGTLDAVDGNFAGWIDVGDKATTRENLQVYSIAEIDAMVDDLAQAIADEIAARIAADEGLQDNIDAETAARIAADDALQAALDDEVDARQAGDLAIIGGAPEDLDTLGKLAAAIEDDADFATTIRAYVDGIVAAQDAMVFQGVIDCSSNPDYPAADRGWTYRASVAGKIGGASGKAVEVGDIVICLTDGTPAGDEATVGAEWAAIQTNLDGALLTTAIGVTVQAYDPDLAEIAALAAADNDVLQRKSGAWVNRTINQLRADLTSYVTASADADLVLTAGANAEYVRDTAILTADRDITVVNTNAWAGARFVITRQGAGGGFNRNLKDAGGTILKVLPPNSWCEVAKSGGGNFYLAKYGTL